MKNNDWLLTLVGMVVLGGLIWGFTTYDESLTSNNTDGTEVEDQLSGEKPALHLEVAGTTEEHRQGLSGRESLPEDTGLLFVFNSSRRHGIWMKDMNFPIDIMWLDEKRCLLDYEAAASPDTFPQVFRPDEPAQFVLETNSGFVDKYQLERGECITDVFDIKATGE